MDANGVINLDKIRIRNPHKHDQAYSKKRDLACKTCGSSQSSSDVCDIAGAFHDCLRNQQIVLKFKLRTI